MLSNRKLQIASFIATQLIQDGMLWGNEFEWFVKTSACYETKFSNDDEYLEFENVVIDLIERRADKRIKVIDTLTDKVLEFKNINQAIRGLGVQRYTLTTAINRKSKLEGRYKVEYMKVRAKDIGA